MVLGLYDRDYRILTLEENEAWEKVKQEEVVGNFTGGLQIRKNLFPKYPLAARHFKSLFPNNYLDILEIRDTDNLNAHIDDFEKLLSRGDVMERMLLSFINNKNYFLVGALLKKYFNFGHHEAVLFKEFPLGTTYQVDYLIIGRNSDGWHFVFVEMESPIGNVTLKNGELGDVLRKGLNQIKDWDLWLEQNFLSLYEVFDKCKGHEHVLPDEFRRLDKTRINYIVVGGRRSDFTDKTYREGRGLSKKNQTYLIHYDNIIDASRMLLGANTY